MACSVKLCANYRQMAQKPSGLSFHKFPKESNLLQKWLNALDIQGEWSWSKYKTVCSQHFNRTDFIFAGEKTFLRREAVPCLLLQACDITAGERSSESETQTGIVTLKQTSRPSTSSNVEASTSLVSVASSAASRNASTKHEMKRKKLPILKRKMSTPKSSSSTSSDTMNKRRRHIPIVAQQASGTSTDSSTKRRRVRIVKETHSYSASPSTFKKKSEILARKQSVYRKKMYTARYKNKKLKEKVSTLQTIINSLKREQLLSENALDHVQKSYDSLPALLMARHLKNIQNQSTTHETYPAPLREFAATLHFYSNRAYEYVREQFTLSLPHQSTLRKWFSNVGFITPAFEVLKLKSEGAKENGRELICSLMLDEMAIRKQIEFDGKKMWGYINVGIPSDNDELQPASEALVIMVVATQAYWKLPIGYFLIKSLSGKEKANIVKESLHRLHEVGVTVTSLTCDGPSAHFTMLKELGCNFENVFEMKTFFTHPSDESAKVFAILDACHMLKLGRNTLASLVDIKDSDGRIISWRYIKKLHEIQEEEGLLFGNKLKKAHIEWYKQKMKVYLAAQIFSRSTADALTFLEKKMQIPEFRGCEATVKFIMTLDGLFDILNSKSPWGKGFKGPLKENNEHVWRPFLLNAVEYILRCSDVSGRPLWMTPRKTPFLGFAITALSVCGIFDEFVKKQRMSYLLSYKFSQDHLETYFCSIRSRNGWNNNPSALQFMRSFRALLLHARITGIGGNCRVIDTTTVLHVPSSSSKIERDSTEVIDVGLCRKYGIDVSDIIGEHNFDVIPNYIPLSDLVTNVVTYIAGFVVKMLLKSTHCMECILHCFTSRNDLRNLGKYKLISQKDRGGLGIPAEGVIQICLISEKTLRKVMSITDNKVPSEDDFFSILTLAISQKFYKDLEKLFPKLNNHFLDSAPDEENHGYRLIKNISSNYCKIRVYNISKKYTAKIQGANVRRQLNKLILFNHQ